MAGAAWLAARSEQIDVDIAALNADLWRPSAWSDRALGGDDARRTMTSRPPRLTVHVIGGDVQLTCSYCGLVLQQPRRAPIAPACPKCGAVWR